MIIKGERAEQFLFVYLSCFGDYLLLGEIVEEGDSLQIQNKAGKGYLYLLLAYLELFENALVLYLDCYKKEGGLI